jgi:CelD/BcsL family acetyltransferase involved in cellulose biosynthesis
MLHRAVLEDTTLSLWWSGYLRDFVDIWPTTDNLGVSRAYVFQTADFLDVWLDTIGKARGTIPCFVAVVDDHDAPHALFPLGVEKVKFGIRVLTFLDGGVSDYNAPVLYPEVKNWDAAFVRKLWDAIGAIAPRFDVAIVDKMPECVRDIENPLMPLVTSHHPHSGYVMNLPESIDEFILKGLPRGQDTRRKLRRLAERGSIDFKIATTPDERNEILEAMIRQKSRRYIETRGVDGFDRPGYRAFFREATSRLALRGSLHLSALAVDGTILATHWGYVVGDRFYYMMPSFEGGEWTRYSPGRHLLNYLIEWSIKNGVRLFDQGIGDEEYKNEYCDSTTFLHQIEKARTLPGRANLLARKVKSSLRETPIWEVIKRGLILWRKSIADG